MMAGAGGTDTVPGGCSGIISEFSKCWGYLEHLGKVAKQATYLLDSMEGTEQVYSLEGTKQVYTIEGIKEGHIIDETKAGFRMEGNNMVGSTEGNNSEKVKRFKLTLLLHWWRK